MVILAIISIAIGGILYFNGNSINNDIDAQMESILNDGISNPGSAYETLGIVLLVVGIALLIIGLITTNKSYKEHSQSNSTENKVEHIRCKRCGTSVVRYSSFCMKCGNPLTEESDTYECKNCGKALPEEYNFCIYCGKEINSQKREEI